MDDSPLAKLPAELRNQIWAHTLQHDQPYRFYFLHHRTDDYGELRLLGYAKAHHLGLIHSCKQLYFECSTMFYNINTFVIYCGGGSAENMMAHLRQAFGEKNARAVSKLVLCSGRRWPSDEMIECAVELHRYIEEVWAWQTDEWYDVDMAQVKSFWETLVARDEGLRERLRAAREFKVAADDGEQNEAQTSLNQA